MGTYAHGGQSPLAWTVGRMVRRPELEALEAVPAALQDFPSAIPQLTAIYNHLPLHGVSNFITGNIPPLLMSPPLRNNRLSKPLAIRPFELRPIPYYGLSPIVGPQCIKFHFGSRGSGGNSLFPISGYMVTIHAGWPIRLIVKIVCGRHFVQMGSKACICRPVIVIPVQ